MMVDVKAIGTRSHSLVEDDTPASVALFFKSEKLIIHCTKLLEFVPWREQCLDIRSTRYHNGYEGDWYLPVSELEYRTLVKQADAPYQLGN